MASVVSAPSSGWPRKAHLAGFLHRLCLRLGDVMDEAGEFGQHGAVDAAGKLLREIIRDVIAPGHLRENGVSRPPFGIQQAVHEPDGLNQVIEHVPIVFLWLCHVTRGVNLRQYAAKRADVIEQAERGHGVTQREYLAEFITQAIRGNVRDVGGVTPGKRRCLIIHGKAQLPCQSCQADKANAVIFVD